MKGIYLSICDLENENSGVSKKINMQLRMFKKLGCSIETPTFNDNTIYEKIINKVRGIIPFIANSFSINIKKYIESIELDEIDFIYIRKTTLDKMFIEVLKNIKMKNSNIKIIMEIPTYPVDNEYNTIIKKLNLNKEKKIRKYLNKYIDRIITFSLDEEIFGIKAINISNLIEKERIEPKRVSNNREIHIIAVALFTFWHGYDRFIEGMKNYYSNNVNKEIILHLVGEGPEIKKYKLLVEKYNLEKYIVFHGKKSGHELDNIYDRCELALDTMGRHRGKIYYNSTLKGKEYGAKGLPIISGVATELDYDKGYKYYMRVDADDTPINILKIIEFYNFIYDSSESKEEIINNIRGYTVDKFDINNGFKPVIDYLRDTK